MLCLSSFASHLLHGLVPCRPLTDSRLVPLVVLVSISSSRNARPSQSPPSLQTPPIVAVPAPNLNPLCSCLGLGLTQSPSSLSPPRHPVCCNVTHSPFPPLCIDTSYCLSPPPLFASDGCIFLVNPPCAKIKVLRLYLNYACRIMSARKEVCVEECFVLSQLVPAKQQIWSEFKRSEPLSGSRNCKVKHKPVASWSTMSEW